MNIVKCELNKCSNYIDREDAKLIMYNNRIVPICNDCDDDTFEEITVGDRFESFEKIEKIRKSKKRFD